MEDLTHEHSGVPITEYVHNIMQKPDTQEFYETIEAPEEFRLFYTLRRKRYFSRNDILQFTGFNKDEVENLFKYERRYKARSAKNTKRSTTGQK